MGAEIDRLELQVQASAAKANSALDNLTKKLETLSSSLSKINGSGLAGLANGVQKLGTAMQSMSNVKSADFTRTANGLKKLAEINSSKLYRTSSALNNLSKSIASIGQMNFNTQSLTNLANSVSKFGGKMAVQASANLPRISNNLTAFVRGMNAIGSVNFDMTGLATLISSINRLGGQSATQATANLPSISRDLRAFISGLNGLQSIKFDMTGLASLVSSISRLGGKSVTNAVANIPLLATALKNLMATLSTAPTVSTNIIQMTNALANLASQGNRVGSTSNSLIGILNNTGSTMSRTRKHTFSLAAAFGKFYATYFLVIRGIKKLWSSIEGSMDYVETFNYFSVAMDKIGKEFGSQFEKYGYDSAESYANSFSERLEELTTKMTGYSIGDNGELLSSNKIGLGLDPNQLMQFQAQVSSVTNSVGLIGETSTNVSKALSMLSSDMSSLFNVDLSTVMTNLQSGLIGQSRALYKYGIDITNTTLQQYAYQYGVEKSVSAMSQAEKMQLRMLAILDQSKVSWGDQANTINSVANQYRVFKQQIANVGRTIGNLFLPIVQKVLPYVNGLIIAVNRLLTSLGFKIHGGTWLTDIMDGISGGGAADGLEEITDATDEMADSLGNASKNANKLKGMLQKFDELNNISTQDNDSDSSSGSGKGGSDIDLSDAIAASLADYESVWNKAVADSKNKAEEIANNIIGAFKKGDYEGIGTYISTGIANALKKIDWTKVYSNAKNFGAGLAKFFNGLITPNLFGTVGKTVAGSLNTAIYTALSFGQTFDFSNLGLSIATGINEFFKEFDFKALAQTLNVWVDGIWTTIKTAIENIDWDKVWDGIKEFFSTLELDTIAVMIGAIAWKMGAKAIIKAKLISLATKALGFITIPIKAAANMIWTGLTNVAEVLKLRLSNAWAAAGGLGGILTADLGTVAASGSMATIGLTIATGLVGSIVAAIAGFNVGKIIGKALFPDDADYYNGFSWKDFFKTITSDWETSLEALGTMLSDGWNSMIRGVFNFDTTLELFDGAGYWFKKISEDFEKGNWGAIGEDIINGIIGGFLGAISFITEPISDLFTGIFNGICKVFGIHSPAKEMEPIGENILSGIVEGFKDKVKEFDKSIKDWFNNGVKPWFTKKRWLDLYDTIKTALVEKWKEVKKYWSSKKELEEVKTTYENIKEKIKERWESVISYWSEKTKLKEVTTTYQNFKEKVKEKWNAVINYWGSKSTLKEVTTTYQNFKEKVKEKWNAVVSYWGSKSTLKEVVTTYENFKEKVKERWDLVTNYWSTKPNLSEITAGIADLKGKLSGAWNDLKKWWDNNKPSLSEIAAKIKLPHLKVEWDVEGVAAKALQKLGLKGFPSFSVSYYAQGGFPEDGWFRANHGEIMGKFDNGQSVVANNRQITEGIAIAVNKGNQENNMLMRQEIALLQRQNELLVGILEKETGISSNDIFNSVRKSAREYSNRTGNPAFDY